MGAPKYRLRVELLDPNDEEVREYVIDRIAELLSAANQIGKPVIPEQHRAVWGSDSLSRTTDKGILEKRVRKLIDRYYTTEELEEALTIALGIAANGVTGLHTMDFTVATANSLVRLLANPDGISLEAISQPQQKKGQTQPEEDQPEEPTLLLQL